jgi:hypothetical protein
MLEHDPYMLAKLAAAVKGSRRGVEHRSGVADSFAPGSVQALSGLAAMGARAGTAEE